MTQVNPDVDRPLPDAHVSRIRTALKLRPRTELPATLVEQYWRVTRLARSMGMSVDDNTLILIMALSTQVIPDEPESFLDVIRTEQLPRGYRVLAKWRKVWKWGRLVRVNNERKIVVTFDDQTEAERVIAPTLVRLPTPAESKKIKDN